MSKIHFIKFISVVLCVAILVATICVVLFVKDNNVKPAIVYDTESGIKLDTETVHNMPKGLTFVSDAETFSDTSVTLTATVLPVTATNKSLVWSIAWAEPNGWTSGKTVTDYVDLFSNDNVATVTFKKRFSVKAVVTATSQDNSNIKATCNIDCAKQLMSTDIVIKTLDMIIWNLSRGFSVLPLLPYDMMSGDSWTALKEPTNTTVEYKHNYSEGTVNNEIMATDMIISSSSAFSDAMYKKYSKYSRFCGVRPIELGSNLLPNLSYANIVEGLCPHTFRDMAEPISVSKYEQLVNVLNSYSSSSDFELTFTFTMKYGNKVKFNYGAKFNRASGPFIVSNVDIDNSGVIF